MASTSQIMMTEGNDLSNTATSQRYQWLGTSYFVNQWGNTKASVALLYDLSHDNNLRSAYSFWSQTTDPSAIVTTDHYQSNVFPFTEGVSDLQLRDNDDLSYLRSTVACSIGKGTCPAL
jgi:hypothetical protein